jgi:type IV pilus assembly protein PilA
MTWRRERRRVLVERQLHGDQVRVERRIDPATGVITVTYGAATPQISTNTIVITPSINVGGTPTQLAAGQSGNIDWSCASDQNATATARALPVAAPGTVQSRYVPTECK